MGPRRGIPGLDRVIYSFLRLIGGRFGTYANQPHPESCNTSDHNTGDTSNTTKHLTSTDKHLPPRTQGATPAYHAHHEVEHEHDPDQDRHPEHEQIHQYDAGLLHSRHTHDIPLADVTLAGTARQTVSALEAIVWQASKGQISRLGTYLVCALTCWLAVPLLYAGWTWLATRLIRYELTTQRLRVRTGVVSHRTDEVELYRVKDFTLEEPWLYRLTGTGNVILETSDRTTPRVVLEAIPRPHALRDALRDTVEHIRVAKGVRGID